MEQSDKIKILTALGIGLMLIITACLFGAAAKSTWGTATDIIPYEELSESQQAALREALELNLFEETESAANLTRLVHPGEEGFVEYRLSINTSGKIPFFIRNPYIKENFAEYDPTSQPISGVRRGYYFRDKKIYITAVYSSKLPFTAVMADIFRAADGEASTAETNEPGAGEGGEAA